MGAWVLSLLPKEEIKGDGFVRFLFQTPSSTAPSIDDKVQARGPRQGDSLWDLEARQDRRGRPAVGLPKAKRSPHSPPNAWFQAELPQNIGSKWLASRLTFPMGPPHNHPAPFWLVPGVRSLAISGATRPHRAGVAREAWPDVLPGF